jgi:hypothetical protein
MERGTHFDRRLDVATAGVVLGIVLLASLPAMASASVKRGRIAQHIPVRLRSAPSRSCDLLPFSATNQPAACWRPYSAASPFNTPLGSSPKLASGSSQIVQNWLSTWSPSNKTSSPRFVAGFAETREDYDHPLYYAQPSDPTYTVHCAEAWGRCAVEGLQIHIPAAAKPAGGSDGHLAVIDQVSGWEYDFWQVRQKPSGGGTLTVSWGGRTKIDGDGLGADATASGFGLAAGIIRPSELAAGEIDHALFMIVKCTNGSSVWPAGSNPGRSCSSIGLSNSGAPAMGQHFFLDMSEAQIEALPDPSWQKTILRAMARYGLYVGDTGGGFVKIESASSQTSFGQADPWVQVAKEAGISPWHDSSIGKDTYTFDLMGAVDWGRYLEVAAG